MADKGSMVNEGQAAGMGGADKAAGAHGENTFQVSKTKQIIAFIRFKPASVYSAQGMSAASGLISSATNAVDSAVGAVENAMASIPGLKMMIKEEKKDSPSEKEYIYDYKDWDVFMPQIEESIQKLDPDNKLLDPFEFSDTNQDGRKAAAQNFFSSQLKPALSSWKNFEVFIHLIGIGQGGNVVNEISNLLAKDTEFNAQKKWYLRSAIYVGTPVYSKIHPFNKLSQKSKGSIYRFGSFLDGTSQITSFFFPNDKLLDFIINCNSNTLSLAVGKLKMTIIKILSLFLGNTAISTGDYSALDKFSSIEGELKKLVEDMVGMIKQMINELTSFADPGKLPDLDEGIKGLDQVPSACADRAKKFFSDLGDMLMKRAEGFGSGPVGIGAQDLMGVFNSLCPLLNQISKMLSTLQYDSEATSTLADQMLEKAGVTELIGCARVNTGIELTDISIEYLQKRMEKNRESKKVDLLHQAIADATSVLNLIENEKMSVKKLTQEQKIKLAASIYALMQPMIASKKKFLEELQNWISGLNLKSILDEISANKYFGMAGRFMNDHLHLQFEPELVQSINKVEDELERIKGFFKKREYGLPEDSLFYIFNVHNKVLNHFHDAVKYQIDQQTGYLDYMNLRDCKNQYVSTGKNTYSSGKQKKDENIIVTQQVS